ncbi:MAG: ribosome biogenesis GTP-binding protein YihA/YsxC [Alkaliphilus sp.]
MKIKTAEIVMSAVASKQYPEGLMPEIALVGRSNVGKSSAINTILGRKKLARTSQNPGKTRTINFYLINEEFHLVDLPGYGYAKVSKTSRAEWGKMMETYLSTRENLREVVLLVDIRHEPSNNDVLMYEWLRHFGYGTIVMATKKDKISKTKLQKHINIIRTRLKMNADDVVIPLSSLKKEGIERVWEAFVEKLESWSVGQEKIED